MPDIFRQNTKLFYNEMPKAKILVSPIVVALFALQAWVLRFAVAPVWPDEALFAQPALFLSKGQAMVTPMLRDQVPSLARFTYWMPPLYFWILSFPIKLFGPLTAVKLVACLFGVLTLTVFCL